MRRHPGILRLRARRPIPKLLPTTNDLEDAAATKGIKGIGGKHGPHVPALPAWQQQAAGCRTLDLLEFDTAPSGGGIKRS